MGWLDILNEHPEYSEKAKTTTTDRVYLKDSGKYITRKSADDFLKQEQAQKASALLKSRTPVFPNADGTKPTVQEASIENTVKNSSDFMDFVNKGKQDKNNYIKNVIDYESVNPNGGIFSVTDYDAAKSITKNQEDTYNYLLGKYGKKRAKKYFDDIKKINSDSISKNVDEEISEYIKNGGTKGKVTGALASTSGILYNPAAYLENVVKGAVNSPIDVNSPLQRGARNSAVSQEALTDGMGFWGKMLTDTGVSMAKSGLALGASMLTGNENVGSALMGLDAAGAKTFENVQKGISPRRNLADATLTGAEEGVFEKLSIGNLLDMDNVGKSGFKNALKQILKQSGVEASEEGFTQIANNLTDLFILGDKSDVMQYYKSLVYNGETPSMAAAKTVWQFGAVDTATAALGGAISGLGFGGIGTVSDRISSQSIGSDIRKSGDSNQIISEAAKGYYGDEAMRMAEAIDNKVLYGGKVNNTEIGDLYKATAKYSMNELNEALKQQKQERNADIAQGLVQRFDNVVNRLKGLSNKKSSTETQQTTEAAPTKRVRVNTDFYTGDGELINLRNQNNKMICDVRTSNGNIITVPSNAVTPISDTQNQETASESQQTENTPNKSGDVPTSEENPAAASENISENPIENAAENDIINNIKPSVVGGQTQWETPLDTSTRVPTAANMQQSEDFENQNTESVSDVMRRYRLAESQEPETVQDVLNRYERTQPIETTSETHTADTQRSLRTDLPRQSVSPAPQLMQRVTWRSGSDSGSGVVVGTEQKNGTEFVKVQDDSGNVKNINPMFVKAEEKTDKSNDYSRFIGREIEIDDRKFVVDSINNLFNKVQLRDITFENSTGFPIFRSESLDWLEYVMEMQENLSASEQSVTDSRIGRRASWNNGVTSGSGEIVDIEKRGNSDMYVIRTDDGKTTKVNEKYAEIEENTNASRDVADTQADTVSNAENRTDTDNNKKISKSMSDEERFNILKNKSLDIVSFNEEKLSSVRDLSIDELKNSKIGAAKPILKTIAEQFDIIGKTYENADIELDFEYSNRSFNESVQKQHTNYDNFAKMLSVFDEVIANAVGIEAHNDRYKGTSREDAHNINNYVLVSAFADKDGIVPVRMLVKEFDDKANSLRMTVSLNKIEDSLHAQTPTDKSDGQKYAPLSSNISLSDFFAKVNPADGDFLKYVPDGFLNDEQKTSKQEAIGREEKYIEQYKNSKDSVKSDDNSADKVRSETNNNTSKKADLQVGDVIEYNGKRWKVTQTGFYMTFENLDKNDKEALFSFVGGMEYFKNTHDYTIITSKTKENTRNDIQTGNERVSEGQAVSADTYESNGQAEKNNKKPQSDATINTKTNNTVEKKEAQSYEDNGILDAENGGHTRRDVSEKVQADKKTERSQSDDRKNSKVSSEKVRGNERLADEEQDSSEGIQHEQPDSGGNIDSDVGKSEDGERGNRTDDNRASKINDFHASKAAAEYIDNTKPNWQDNINAIETLKRLEETGKKPTKAEQEVLSRFKSWGGLANIFANMWSPQYRHLSSLLTESEMAAAKATVNNAHYTSTKVISGMYDMLRRMGFTNGNILEPSMGIGNFFAVMPQRMKGGSNLYGVEIDSITGRMAQMLYPNANISISPFEDVNYKDGAFDVVIGNVPFLNVSYPYRGGKYMLHDYFFVKSLDKLRDGGVMIALTSTGTLDKMNDSARHAIADRANLVAAFRLPNNAFKTNAGTEVTTDLLILQKRPEGVNQSGESFAKISKIDNIPINEYFAAHPENILGKLVYEKGMYAQERAQVISEGDFEERFKKAVNSLPKDIINIDMTEQEVFENSDTQKPHFEIRKDKNGQESIVFSENGKTKKITDEKEIKRISKYLKIKETYNDLLKAAQNGENIKEKQTVLSEVYDDFVNGKTKKDGFGNLLSRTNKNALDDDADYWRLSGLEVEVTDSDKKKTIRKSDIFTRDTIGYKAPTNAENSQDALAVSMSTKGRVDLKYMSALTGKSEGSLLDDLNEYIIETPDGEYQLIVQYLSGNIREKLRVAEEKKMTRNVELLKAAMPEDIPASKISPALGAPWISPKYINQFAEQKLNAWGKPNIKIDKSTTTWTVESFGCPGHTVDKYGVMGSVAKALEYALNMKSPTIRKKIDGGYVTDVKATQEARQKIANLKNEFNEWIFKDKTRRDELVKEYNERFNSNRTMDFETMAQYMTFPEMDSSFKMRDYQKRAVARVVFGGNTLLAHGVGTGKTAEMIASAMELKRMGIVKKNIMVVPKHKISDFRNDALQMYPNAKILMADGKDFEPKKLSKALAKIATNDWDIVIIGHPSFQKIPVSRETQEAYIRQELESVENAILAAKADSPRGSREIKQLENSKKNVEAKLKALLDTPKNETLTFEEMGIDSIFVDEAHNFKNLNFYTKLNVAGVKTSNAKQAEDMYMKTSYLRNKGGKVTFATATPITNTMSEMYNMTRYVRPDLLEEAGIYSFDGWAATFGEVVNAAEMAPDGKTRRMKERFSKYKNGNQLIGMFRTFADILRTQDVVKELPKAEYIDVVSPSEDIHELYISDIMKRIKSIQSSGQNKSDNMLLITNDGRAMATDLRLVASQLGGYSNDELDLPNSRINQCVKNVYEAYKNSTDVKGTQFVFLDFGMNDNPEARYSFNLYNDLIEKLVKSGIPREEIAKIGDYETTAQKEDLFEKMNNGNIRVLIGSTAKMGEGMNAQKRAVAMHHLNAPYRPSDIEQREGRIIRFGNINKDVKIYRYIQEGSFDSYMWQMLARKGEFINQAMSGADVSVLEEVDDFVLTAKQGMAIATGNPLLLEKVEIDEKVKNLSAAKHMHELNRYDAEDRIAKVPSEITAKEKLLEKTIQDIKTAGNPKDFVIEVNGKKFDKRNDELASAIKKFISDNSMKVGKNIKMGTYRGFDLYFHPDYGNGSTIIVKGAVESSIQMSDSPIGTVSKIVNYVEKLPETKTRLSEQIKSLNAEYRELQEDLKAPFKKQSELDKLLKRQEELAAELGENEDNSEIIDIDDNSDNESTSEKVHYSLSDRTDRANSDDTLILTGTQAQMYNIMTSNLKRTAEQLGFDMNEFYDNTSDVNAFMPSKSDVERINKELHKLFNNTDDKYIKDWLNAIDNIYSDDNNFTELNEIMSDEAPENETDSSENTENSRNKNDTSDNSDNISEKKSTEPSKPIQQIIKEVSDRLRLPVGTGKITNRNANGIFKEHANVIRLRIANDLPILAHELGHYFDSKYNFSELSGIDEVISNSDNEFLEQYPESEHASEAFAEFMRVYLLNREAARRTFPKFSAEFENIIRNTEDFDTFDKAAHDMNQYMTQGVLEKMSAAMSTEKDAEKLYKLTTSETREKRRMEWVDAFAPIERAAKFASNQLGEKLYGADDAYTLATNSLNAQTKTANILKVGLFDINGHEIGSSFFECLSGINAKDTDDFQKYLIARHAPYWLRQDMRVYADDDLNDIETMERVRAEYEKNHPEFKEAAEKLYEFQRKVMQAYLVDTGIITQRYADSLWKKYPDYIPLRRVVGKNINKAKSTFANQNVPIRRAHGSGLAIISPLESIVSNTQKYVTAAMRNQTMQALAHYADTVDGFGEFMERVPPDMVRRITDISQEREGFAQNLDELFADESAEIMNAFDDVFGNEIISYDVGRQRHDIVTVLRNGEKQYYQVHDRNFLEAIAELTPKEIDGIDKFCGNIMNATKALQTSFNYVFALRNPIRDIKTGYSNSIVTNPFEYAKLLGSSAYDVGKMFFSIFTDKVTMSDDYRQFIAMGGGHSSELTANMNQIQSVMQGLARKDKGGLIRFAESVFRHPLHSLAAFSDFTETVPRLAEFKAAKARGLDNQQAIYNADKVTTNFKRAGTKGRRLNKFYMYFNASVQGLDVFYGNIKSKPLQQILKYLIPSILSMLVMQFWNRHFDKDGWENLSQYTKNNYYCYSLGGNGKFVKIPKAREAAVFDSFAERVWDSIADGDAALWRDFAGYAAENLLPNIVPTSWITEDELPLFESIPHEVFGNMVIGPFVDSGFNRDFKGTPIVSETMKNQPKREQYTGRTSFIAVQLGKMLNQSPLKIDHIIKSSSGILGTINSAWTAVEKSERKLIPGLSNSFTADANYSTDIINRAYTKKDKAVDKFTFNKTSENGMNAEKQQLITSYISGMSKAIKSLPYEQQSAARGQMLENVKNMQQSSGIATDAVTARFGDALPEDFILTKLPSSTLERTQNKVKQTYQLSPDEYNQMIDEIITEVTKIRQNSLPRSGNAADDKVAKTVSEQISKKVSDIKDKYKKKHSKEFTAK